VPTFCRSQKMAEIRGPSFFPLLSFLRALVRDRLRGFPSFLQRPPAEVAKKVEHEAGLFPPFPFSLRLRRNEEGNLSFLFSDPPFPSADLLLFSSPSSPLPPPPLIRAKLIPLLSPPFF